MMNPKTQVYCKDIGTYKDQLTKRKAYLIEERNENNVRIKDDQGRLNWYADFYFDAEPQPEISLITIDDPIQNAICDIVEVTIEFSNKEKYWTTFTTPDYLKKLLDSHVYFSMKELILVSELTENRIKEIVIDLDEQNELLENCKKH